MQRRLLTLVIVAGIMVLSVRFLVNRPTPNESPLGMELRLVEYNVPTTPLNTTTFPMTELQTTLDRVSEAALKGNWTMASSSVRELDDAWQRIKPQQTSTIQAERDIEKAILSLYSSVWNQDEQEVLSVAQRLTLLINALSG
ncbi:MAG: hypothetical protein GX971_06590 [Firmicutes bacterium]|nr:hypothetical protein [Bacillota bacterium]